MPKAWRIVPNFQKRFLYFVSILIGVLIISSWGYVGVGNAFGRTPREYQWIVGLLTPLVVEFNTRLLLKVSYLASGRNSSRLNEITCQHYMETRHALFLAIMVGSISTRQTTYVILAVTFVINMYKCLTIVNKAKKNEDGKFAFTIQCTYNELSKKWYSLVVPVVD